nr:hypothetical protein [Prolixibacteraceae bacterium]
MKKILCVSLAIIVLTFTSCSPKIISLSHRSDDSIQKFLNLGSIYVKTFEIGGVIFDPKSRINGKKIKPKDVTIISDFAVEPDFTEYI